MPLPVDPNLIIGGETGDDAGVYVIAPDQALVFTVDCFKPIHDDPFTFGQITAANSLSDVWAMGGRPLMALNVCGFPDNVLPLELLAEILRGGASKCAEAGVPIAGGHTMRAEEPFYGLAVIGTVHPDRIISNAGARPGDQLVLTKPLGIGIVMTAAMSDDASTRALTAATRTMTTLNRAAAEVMVRCGATACTDVTGFGLVGHARHLAKGSGVGLQMVVNRIPVLPGALLYARQGHVTGGGASNEEHYEQWTDFGPATDAQRAVLCDPQTSGGLLIALPKRRLSRALAEMAKRGVVAAHIGEVVADPPGRVLFR